VEVQFLFCLWTLSLIVLHVFLYHMPGGGTSRICRALSKLCSLQDTLCSVIRFQLTILDSRKGSILMRKDNNQFQTMTVLVAVFMLVAVVLC
jgi:hypothetical protein